MPRYVTISIRTLMPIRDALERAADDDDLSLSRMAEKALKEVLDRRGYLDASVPLKRPPRRPRYAGAERPDVEAA